MFNLGAIIKHIYNNSSIYSFTCVMISYKFILMVESQMSLQVISSMCSVLKQIACNWV
jgi:hypothetical protein